MQNDSAPTIRETHSFAKLELEIFIGMIDDILRMIKTELQFLIII